MVFGLQHQLNVTILVLGWNHYSIGPTKAIKHWIGGLFLRLSILCLYGWSPDFQLTGDGSLLLDDEGRFVLVME